MWQLTNNRKIYVINEILLARVGTLFVRMYCTEKAMPAINYFRAARERQGNTLTEQCVFMLSDDEQTHIRG